MTTMTKASVATSSNSPLKDSEEIATAPVIKTESDPETSVTTTVAIRSSRRIQQGANSNAVAKVEEPGEELLGSVTFPSSSFSSSSNSGAVRSSARVIQKTMEATTLIAGGSGQGASNGAGGGAATNSTGGSQSSSVNNSGKPPSAPKTPTHSRNHHSNHHYGPSQAQTTTTKRLWSNMERSLFFEALNEFGKDFDAIAQHINQKMRRKVFVAETSSCKSRDQVRHMYMQMFQKASKYLRFSEDVKRVPQELYALINYGEMRRKMPFMHEKAFMKLKELVYRGSVTIREKGKTIRIRTPSCRALKKLNQLEEWQEEVTLPQRIEINLVPATIESWGRVQGLAQNPRVKTSLPLYKRVSCLLKFLQNKWRSQDMRLCEKTMSYQQAPISRGRPNQKQLSQMPVLGNQDLLEQLKNKEALLCLAPPAKTIIHRPMVNLTDFSNSYSICLNSYEDRIGAKCRGEELPVEKVLTHKERLTNGKRLRLDSGGEASSGGSNKKGAAAAEKKVKAEGGTVTNSSDGENNNNNNNKGTLLSEEETTVVGGAPPVPPQVDIQMFDFSLIQEQTETLAERIDLFSDNSEDKKIENLVTMTNTEEVSNKESTPTTATSTPTPTVPKSTELPSTSTATGKSNSSGVSSSSKRTKGAADNHNNKSNRPVSFRPLISEEAIRKIKEGWSLNTCGDLTFGDLYVMFGSDFKIQLEYKWVQKEIKEEAVTVAVVVKEEEATKTTPTTSQEKVPRVDPPVIEVDKGVEQLLGRRLSQLLMIANLMDKSMKKECTCDRDGKMKENDYPYPDSNLFKHPALPLRYSHYNGYNSMLQLRRLKPRQVYPFPTPKPYMSAPHKYHQAGRSGYSRPPLPALRDEAGRDGDAEDDGDEGTSGVVAAAASNSNAETTSAKRNVNVTKEPNRPTAIVEKVPVAVQTITSSISTTTEITSTTEGGQSSSRDTTTEDDEEEEDDEVGEEEEFEGEDYSKNPGLLSLLDISLPSIRVEENNNDNNNSNNNRQGWLEDNINDYSFSSLLGHIDMHLNGHRESEADDEGGAGSESGSSRRTAGMSNSSSGGSSSVIRNEMMSDRCSIISETSVDFVNKFAELSEMIQEH